MLKNKLNWIFVMAILALSFQACEDPETTFDPVNPDLSEEAILGTSQSATRTINGLERQLAELAGEYVHLSEIASDNYDNTQTFYNQFLDVLNVTSTDDDVDDTQFEIGRLRELAKAGLNNIGPADPGYTPNQEAEFNYFIGVAHLLSAELYKALPAEPLGAAQPASAHFDLAIGFFEKGAGLATEPRTQISCLMGQARANYYAGNQSAAVAAADAAIAADPGFIRYIQFDVLNGARVDNEIQNAIHDRGSFDDLQPLPRLDFLDPKYNDENASVDYDIPFLKIEEAHLIKCEAAIADGALGDAQDIMRDILGLVATRPTSTFDDSAEDRTERMPDTRPDSVIVNVAPSPGADFISGLVLNRKDGPITVPVVSGTSVTEDMIDAVGSEDEALELLYLLRQEIFIAEGRRMTDMGIKFVVSQVEQLANPAITEDDTTPNLPEFFTSIATELDAIQYVPESTECTILHNVNEIIVANKASDFVCPFH